MSRCVHCGKTIGDHWFPGMLCEPRKDGLEARVFTAPRELLTPPEARALHMRVRGYACDLSLLESATAKLAAIATQDGSRLHASGYWTFPHPEGGAK